jgi:hypothetical protein
MYSSVSYTGNGVTTDYAIPFPYLLTSHVEVLVNAVAGVYTWLNAATIRFTAAPGIGAAIVIRRNSNRLTRLVDFTDSSTLTETDLDKNADQLLYLVQEAFDQSTVGEFFSTDAAGSRVTNVADPIANSDAATKGWVQATFVALAAAGVDILDLNNTWTGTNLFNNTVSVKGAVFDGVDVALKNVLNLNRGLHINNVTTTTDQIGYGLQIEVHRASGYSMIVGAQLDAINEGVAAMNTFGAAVEAFQRKTGTGNVIGLESTAGNLNSNDPTGQRVGLDVVFKNRADSSSTGGFDGVNAPDGTGQNYYNSNSWAIQLSAQSRSDSGATYVGWNRGLRVRDQAIDVAKIAAYSATTQYTPGDYALSGGRVYINKESSFGVAPAVGGNANWADMGVSTERKGIILDLSGYGATMAGRLLAAVKFRGDAPVLWDTEEHISTRFDTTVGRWMLKNDTAERIGFDVGNADIYVNGVARILGTQSVLSAHRNFSGASLLGTATWNVILYPTKESDARGEYNTSTGRFIAQTAGWYRVTHQAQTDGGATAGASFYAGIAKNGTLRKAANVICVAGVSNTAQANDLVFLNPGDYIEAWVFLSSGSTGITGEPGGSFLLINKAP